MRLSSAFLFRAAGVPLFFAISCLGLLAFNGTVSAEIRCGGSSVSWRSQSRTVVKRTHAVLAAASKNAYAISRQRITKGTGCISFIASGSALERVVGIARGRNLNSARSFIAAVHLRRRGQFSLIINGLESGGQWTYRSGDRFFISIDGGSLELWKNGAPIGAASGLANEPLYFAASLKRAGAAIGAPRLGSGACERWLRNGTCASMATPPPVPTVSATPPPPAGPTPVPGSHPTAQPTPVATPISGTVYYVSASGSDSSNGSSEGSAWRTIRHAVSAAQANSTVLIRAGTYNETLTIGRSNITLQGYPGDAKPVITSSSGSDSSTVLIGTGASYITLKDLNISGGYYSVKFDSSWSNGGGGTGPQHITIEGCVLHDSGSHVVKIQPKANYITIKNSEIYRSGRRSGLEGQGIDAVNVANLTFQDNYIHDTTHVCLFTKGGSTNSVVQRNVMINCGWSGILLGQDTGTSFMDGATNPNLYECINCTARNNIVINTGYAGIGSYSASGTKIYNNTIVNASSTGQAAIFLSKATTGHSGPAGTNYDIQGNIITVNAGNRQALAIAAGAYAGTPTMNNNVYYSGGGSVSFVDNRGGGTRSFSAWRSATGQDGNSIEANPDLIGPQFLGYSVYPSSSSPAVGRFPNASSSGYTDDYFHSARPAGAWDSGAVQH